MSDKYDSTYELLYQSIRNNYSRYFDLHIESETIDFENILNLDETKLSNFIKHEDSTSFIQLCMFHSKVDYELRHFNEKKQSEKIMIKLISLSESTS